MDSSTTVAPGRARKLTFGLVLFGFCVLFTLLVGEVLARVMMPPQREVPRWFVPHERYGFFQWKNFEQVYDYMRSDVTWTSRINELGLRGGPYDPGPPGSRRVLLIGDSFTFGYGLEEDRIFSAKLSRLLNASTAGWVVINAGVGGWGTMQQSLFARDHWDLFQPDAIVLTVCDNDANDDTVFRNGKAGGLLPGFPGKKFLRDHSYLYKVLYAKMSMGLWRRAVHREDVTVQEAEAQPAIVTPDTHAEAFSALVDRSRIVWGPTLQTIRELHRDYIAKFPNGVLFIQMAQPTRYDIRHLLMELDNGHNLLFVDLEHDAKVVGPLKQLLRYDPHWTEDMHYVSASNLCRAILARVPPPAVPEPVEFR